MIFTVRALWLLLAGLLSAAAAEPVALTGHAMGTTWAVKFVQPSPPLDPVTVTASIAARLEQLEQQFSTYRPTSELSRFNAARSTEWIPVSPEVARVALDSRRLSELTDGAFDVTVEPLLSLWGFGPQRRIDHPPTDTEIAATRARVDYRRLEIRLSPPALRKTAATVSVDFSSMAKGFAADAVSDLLLSLHTPDHFAQVGGDIKTHGHPASSTTWRTGIEQPPPSSPSAADAPASGLPSPTALAAVVALSGQALSTSGGAHNFVTLAGQRYDHIMDPRIGRPAESTLVSVSVVADSCAQSSALATALFVLGPEAGPALATREHLAALFLIWDDGQVSPHPTPEFKRLAPDSLQGISGH